MPFFFKIIGLVAFSYLLGSIPWGLVLTKCFTHGELLKQGSGNIGATNVRRVAGTRLGVATLLGDVLKGAIPVFMAYGLLSTHGVTGGAAELLIVMVALASFFGHLFPIYLKFKTGGKGVATAAGCYIVISPLACIVATLTFVLLVCLFNRVSVGSLGAAGILPVFVWVTTSSLMLSMGATVIAAAIFFRHKENIKRLFSGREPPAIKGSDD